MKPAFFIAVLMLSTFANAEIYEIIDEHGRKNYTDKPPLNQPDAQPITTNPKTGNAWQKDAIQESNDRYYDELLKKRALEAEKLQTAKEEKAATKKQLADAINDAENELEAAKELKSGDYYPNQQGGLRYTQAYRDRISEAEKKLEEARKAAANAP